jgi:hypothetical protein
MRASVREGTAAAHDRPAKASIISRMTADKASWGALSAFYYAHGDTDRESSPSFDRRASAKNGVSFLGLFPPKVHKTVSFFVSFHRDATRSWCLCRPRHKFHDAAFRIMPMETVVIRFFGSFS